MAKDPTLGSFHNGDWLQTYVDGIQTLKFQSDLDTYAKVLEELKPDTIIETGTLKGGSARFFSKFAKVITIDITPQCEKVFDDITYIHGSSTDPEIVAKVKKLIKGRCMVILDSDHTKSHVAKEIELYSPLVSPGCYLVVEDTFISRYTDNYGYPNQSSWEAVEEWDKKGFTNVEIEPEITMNPRGWFRCAKQSS